MFKHKFFSLFVALFATTALWAQNNVITYTATYKLLETTGFRSEGLHTNAFNVSISSHTFSNGTGTITFSGEVITIGESAFYYCSGLTSVTIPNSVTTIGWGAFSGCSGLTSITIPNSVATIGWYAFSDCSGLTSPVYNANCFAYMPTSYKGAYTIPDGIKQIAGGAFYGCSGLTSITIPYSVKTIEESAFYDCSSLKKTNYTGTIADWCKIMFSIYEGDISSNPMCYSRNFFINDVEVKDLVIPQGVDLIGNGAFYGCSGLTSVTIPNSVTTIGDLAFYGCSGLTSVTIPNSVTTIGESAFSGCTSLPVINNLRYADTYLVETVDKTLSTYTIKEDTKWIGKSAFYSCSGLTSVTIPNSVTTIGSYAFYGCSSLTSVTIPNSVTTIGDRAFSNVNNIVYSGTATWEDYDLYWGAKCMNGYVEGYVVYSDATKTKLCGCSAAATGEITIPNSVTTIGSNAFRGCTGLTSVTIPNSVTTIREYAFSGVLNIIYSGTATGSPWGAKYVNGYVDGYLVYSDASKTKLCGCSAAATGEITIPNSVTTIGSNAFVNCSANVYYEDFFNQYASSFPSAVRCKNPITYTLDKQICNITLSFTIPKIYNDWYDEIGVSDGKTSSANYFAVDREGTIAFTNLPFNYSKTFYIYAKKGTEYVYKNEITISTKTPSLSCSSSATQTTITLSNITASTDESVTTFSKGIYYNRQYYESDNDSVVLQDIAPNKKCTVQVYGCYNGQYYYGAEKYIFTKAINPTITTSQVAPTSVYVHGSYTHGDATILGTTFSSYPTNVAPQGDEGCFTGLKPNTSYTFYYSVDTKEGGTYTATKTITTPALELTTLTPKVVSAGTAVVAAETNISDYETNVGFEWRKDNAPAGAASKSSAAIICNGVMEGRLLNLGTEWWRVRPYYEDANGKRYYGKEVYIDPTDFSYFEPTVHTYALATSPTVNKVQVRGYVMTGTDDVTEQGFEYWFKGKKAPRRMPSATPDSIYRVLASGQVMTAVLEDLAYSTTYTCRAYAIAGGKTYYGEEVQFLTPEDPRPLYTLTVSADENGNVNEAVAGQYREGEQVTLIATPNEGYTFKEWSDGTTDNPYTITIMSDTTLTATFEELSEGIDEVTDSQKANVESQKFIRDGILYIRRNGKTYNALGGKVR